MLQKFGVYVGIYQVYTRYLPGLEITRYIYLVYTWYIPPISPRLVYTWYIPGIYQVNSISRESRCRPVQLEEFPVGTLSVLKSHFNWPPAMNVSYCKTVVQPLRRKIRWHTLVAKGVASGPFKFGGPVGEFL